MKDKPMTAQQVAEYLEISLVTVYKLAKEGTIPAAKFGREWRFKKLEIDKAMTKKYKAKKRK